MSGAYQIDTTVRLAVLFTNATDGQPVDPDTVTLYVEVADGTKTEIVYGVGSIIRTGIGAYYHDLVADEVGTYLYKWQGSGAVAVTSPDGFFTVNKSAFLP